MHADDAPAASPNHGRALLTWGRQGRESSSNRRWWRAGWVLELDASNCARTDQSCTPVMSCQVPNNRDGRPEEEEQEEEKLEFLWLARNMYLSTYVAISLSLPCGCGHCPGKKIIWDYKHLNLKNTCLESSICGRVTEAVLTLKRTWGQIAGREEKARTIWRFVNEEIPSWIYMLLLLCFYRGACSCCFAVQINLF